MAFNLENMTVDYKKLLNVVPTQRTQLAQSGAIDDLVSALTPGQLTNLFPKYYRDKIPDIGSATGVISGAMTGVGGYRPSGGGNTYTPSSSSNVKLTQTPEQKAIQELMQKAGIRSGFDSGDIRTNKQYLLDAMNKGGITDPEIRAAMMAVVKGESQFKSQTEQDYSNTSNERIRGIFSRVSGMSDDQLTTLKQDPEAFFNTVYGNKLGNSPTEGYMYRGRGFFQLTGKSNYEKYGNMIGVDLVSNPDLANDPEIAAKIAIAYMQDRYDLAPGNSKREKVFRAVGNAVESTEVIKNSAYSEYLQTGEFSPDKIAQIEGAAEEIRNLDSVLSNFNPETITQLDQRLQKWYSDEKRTEIERKRFEASLAKLGPEEFNQVMSRQAVNSATLQAVSDIDGGIYKLTDKLGELSPNLRQFDPNRDDPGGSVKGEFNYSLSQEGIQRYNLADESGRITPASVEKNLVTVKTNSGIEVKIHKDIADNTLKFLNELEARGYPVRGADTGGYSFRNKNGGKGSGLSTHSTGTTFDINSQTNWGTMRGGNGTIDMPPDIEKLANYYGFSWGAKFGDPMHFETMSPEVHAQKLKELEDQGYVERRDDEVRAKAEEIRSSSPVTAAGIVEENIRANTAPAMATGGLMNVPPGENIVGINTTTGETEFVANDRENIRVDPATLENKQQLPTITPEDNQRLEAPVQPMQFRPQMPLPRDNPDPDLYSTLGEGIVPVPPSQVRAANRAKLYGEDSGGLVNGHFS